MQTAFTGKKRWLTFVVLAALGGLGWWQRGPIAAWHTVRQLSQADEENRDAWAKKVADLDEAAIPRLLDGLRDPDATVCANLQIPLLMMTKSWGQADPRTIVLLERLRDRFPEFRSAGQERVLLLVSETLQEDGPRPLPPRLTKVAGDLLTASETKPELRAASLRLAAELVDCVEAGQWVDVARTMAERGLKDEAIATRVAALHLLAREPMRKDKDLLEQTIVLLRDPAPAIRKAALLVLASENELLREESLLPLLHDDDAAMQHLAELALRRRGLGDEDISVARMISAPEPSTRMRVFQSLHRMQDLNLAGLLRQLSHDPSPAVRAAAARAAGENAHLDLADRLREMAANDPSESVRQNAQFYLQLRARRAALD